MSIQHTYNFLPRRKLEMKGRKRSGSMARLVLMVMFASSLVWGCTGRDSYGLLELGLDALDARLQSHDSTISGIMNSIGDGTMGIQPDETWEMILMETEDYGQDMHWILGQLGEGVSMMGTCQMMMGGTMFGSPTAGDTCPSQPYMDGSTAEIDQHLSEMLTWMEQENLQSLWEEMDTHWEQMGTNLLDMRSHMQETFGPPEGGMMDDPSPGGMTPGPTPGDMMPGPTPGGMMPDDSSQGGMTPGPSPGEMMPDDPSQGGMMPDDSSQGGMIPGPSQGGMM
jgi:hypothetical protein